MKVSYIAGLGPLVRDPASSLAFYRDVLGIPLAGSGDYVSADNWEGTRHFGQWTLEDAAESIFGTRDWPAHVPVPQVNIEFEVERPEEVEAAAFELAAAGYPPLVGPKVEPWGQTVVRLIAPEGHLVSIVHTPWFHES
jgi:catechol 2,3-dioxygenase-like lactoylglutathione lyase family enzyme